MSIADEVELVIIRIRKAHIRSGGFCVLPPHHIRPQIPEPLLEFFIPTIDEVNIVDDKLPFSDECREHDSKTCSDIVCSQFSTIC